MLPYIIILFFVVSVVYFEAEYLGRKAIIFPSIFLILFSSIRSYTVGTDSISYTEAYRFEYNPYYYGFNSNIEYGYQFFDYFILNFSYNYFWLFLLTSILIVPLYMVTIKKLSINYYYSVFIYITFGFYTFLFNTVRQAIALAILFYGIKFFLEKKLIKYLAVVLIASLFHISAWVMIPFYFIVHFKFKVEIKAILTFISSAILSSIVIQYMSASNQRYEQYTQESENSGGYLLLLFYVIIAAFLYIFGRTLRVNNKTYSLLEQLYFCGLMFVIPIALLGTDPSGPQRVLYNFSVYLILLIPMVLRDQFNKSIYIGLFYILAFIYFMMITYSLYGIYPYVINDVFRIF